MGSPAIRPPVPAFHPRDAVRARIDDPAIADLLYRTDAPAGIEELLPDPSDLWAITPALGRFIGRLIVERGRRSVLEFGAGSSSVVAAQALSLNGGGKLTSLEARPEWCADRWAQVEQRTAVDSALVGSRLGLRLGRGGAHFEYLEAAEALPARGPFDFVLVDGPPWFYGRDGAIPTAIAHLAPGAIVVLDDAARLGERRTVARWLQSYPGLRLAVHDPGFGRGIAILLFDGDAGFVARPGVALGTIAQAAMLAWRRLRM